MDVPWFGLKQFALAYASGIVPGIFLYHLEVGLALFELLALNPNWMRCRNW